MLLEKYLKQNNIEKVQIIFNSIFKDLYEAIALSDDMSTIDQRSQFENKIKEIIDIAIQNYGTNSEEYQKNIEEIMS